MVLQNFQISKLVQTCKINWVSDWKECLDSSHQHYSRILNIIKNIFCMQVYSELSWGVLVLMCLFQSFLELLPKHGFHLFIVCIILYSPSKSAGKKLKLLQKPVRDIFGIKIFNYILTCFLLKITLNQKLIQVKTWRFIKLCMFHLCSSLSSITIFCSRFVMHIDFCI